MLKVTSKELKEAGFPFRKERAKLAAEVHRNISVKRSFGVFLNELGEGEKEEAGIILAYFNGNTSKKNINNKPARVSKAGWYWQGADSGSATENLDEPLSDQVAGNLAMKYVNIGLAGPVENKEWLTVVIPEDSGSKWYEYSVCMDTAQKRED